MMPPTMMPPMMMNCIVDMSCEIQVNKNCQLCHQKVTEIMHSVDAVYSVDFLGANDTLKLKARADPYLILAVIERYGNHGKLNNFRLDGQVMSFKNGGIHCQSGYYLPNAAARGYYYPPPPIVPYGYAGNYSYPKPNPPNPPKGEEGPRRVQGQHTAPPSYYHPPPPSRPLSSYSYIQPPYFPSSGSGGCCVIM